VNYPALDKSIVYAGFTRGSSFISKQIRFWSEEEVNHAFFLYHSRDWGCWLEHGAINSGFNAVAAGQAGLVKDSVHLLIPPVDLRVGMQAHPELLNSRYGWGELLGMLPVELAERLGKKIRNPFARKASNFCSEAMALIVDASGAKVEYDRGEKPSTLNPGELLRTYLRAGWRDHYATAPAVAA
jgi:hypothetical protein